jgi:cell division protease FtsH
MLLATVLLATLMTPPVAAAAAVPLAGRAAHTTPMAASFSYSDLLRAIDRQTVRDAQLHPMQGTVDVTLKSGAEHEVSYPPLDTELSQKLATAGAKVDVDNKATSDSGSVFGRIIGVMLLLGLLGFVLFIVRNSVKNARSGNGLTGNKGTMKASQIKPSSGPQTVFADVAGCDEVVDALQEVVMFLTQPSRFTRLGAKMPRGVLLHGSPGTGKTLIARAVAGEAGVAFFAVSGSDFVEMFVGRGAARVRELFSEARKAPGGAVIFIDEFDALGKKRSSGPNTNDEREQTLNQLLVEMDGFRHAERIVCIAATNRKDTLDPAVLRPGRFGMHLHVDLPSEQGRLQILGVHARNKPLADDVDLKELARVTYGSSGADLADMLNRAAIIAAVDGAMKITQKNLQDGYLDAIAGPRKRSAIIADGEREVVAVHEAGHVLCAELCPTMEKAQHVSIEQRGNAGGMAVYGQADRMLQSQQYLHEKLVCALGGRAAEFVSKGHITSGAASDLQYANGMARQAVEELGFSTRAGQLVSSRSGEPMRVSDQTSTLIDEEVRRLVEDAYQDAIRILQAHKDALQRLADALLTAENLDRPEIVACLNGAAEAPRAAPRQAAPSAPHVVAVDTPVSAVRPTRPSRVRARLAAALLRQRPVKVPSTD